MNEIWGFSFSFKYNLILFALFDTKFANETLNEYFGKTPNTAHSSTRTEYGVISRH